MRTKTCVDRSQWQRLKALGLHLSPVPPATEPNSIVSRTNTSQPDLAHTTPHDTCCTSVNSQGPLTPTFPDVFPGLMEHSWMYKAPTLFERWGLCRHLQEGKQEASPGVHHTHPQPKRWAQPKNLETPRDIWNNLPLVWVDIAAATRLIVFFLEQSWKSLKGQ